MSHIYRIAVPCPLRRLLDYLPPKSDPDLHLDPGTRVSVPLGQRTLVGVVVETAARSELAPARLRRIQRVLDTTPSLPPDLLELGLWLTDYYQHPPGEAVAALLPAALRRTDGPPLRRRPDAWRPTAAGLALDPAELERRPAQARALAQLVAGNRPLHNNELTAAGIKRHALDALARSGWAERCHADAPAAAAVAPPLTLHPEQHTAVAAILQALGSHRTLLLDGVTGSGKTEVYFQAIAATVAAGHQALLLVPEISLTPQTLRRIRSRFSEPVAISHSGLSDTQRLQAWRACANGTARICIGTRSGIFAPLPDLGLIVVDEEHDESFKQQDGLRYSARDVAVKRGYDRGCPVVLGSATPSLESLHNARGGRYTHLQLLQRAGGATSPRFRLLDLRRHHAEDGLSTPLLQAIGATLQRGEQGLVFLNRRGYAPVLMCHDCGWIAACRRCDARLTLHRDPAGLRCHHCGAQPPLPSRCPSCDAPEPMPVGLGTQRTEDALRRHFPDVPVLRIDRDSTRSARALDATLARIDEAGPALLVGTQMLAKGHHFPRVTQVAILDADAGLFSADFRAPERMAQLLLQVAGRAGRAEQPGEVVVQTHHPDNPLLLSLIRDGYPAFAEQALAEREAAQLPPFAHMAILRAEAPTRAEPQAFLDAAAAVLGAQAGRAVDVLGPMPCVMERRAGRFRAQLLLQAARRGPLHGLLSRALDDIDALAEARKVRWHLDIDPLDTQ